METGHVKASAFHVLTLDCAGKTVERFLKKSNHVTMSGRGVKIHSVQPKLHLSVAQRVSL